MPAFLIRPLSFPWFFSNQLGSPQMPTGKKLAHSLIENFQGFDNLGTMNLKMACAINNEILQTFFDKICPKPRFVVDPDFNESTFQELNCVFLQGGKVVTINIL